MPISVSCSAPPDIIKAGGELGGGGGAPNLIPPGAKPVDVTWQPLVRGAYNNLRLWSRKGLRPPQAPGIKLDRGLEIDRDADGSALGGVRSPYIDVPVRRIQLTPAWRRGRRDGCEATLCASKLKALYPDKAAYAARFNAATDWCLSAAGSRLKTPRP